MTTFPVPLGQRFVEMIRGHDRNISYLLTQMTKRGSQVQNLLPQPWANIALLHGWSNVAGKIPAQLRLVTATTVQLIGNIQFGTINDGTVIGVAPTGFFNSAHSHTFTVNVVSGASSVQSAGSVTNPAISQGTIPIGAGNQIPTSSFTFNSFPVKFGPQSGGQQFSNDVGGTNINSQVISNPATQTGVNLNQPCITFDTSGNIILHNIPTGTTQISFHEPIPLYTV